MTKPMASSAMARRSRKLMAGCLAPKIKRATNQARAMSVAVGIPQPFSQRLLPMILLAMK